jgi:hypothetical protein
MKKFFGFWRRQRETLHCRLRIHFLADDLVVPQIEWQLGRPSPEDWRRCLLFYYARIMFELAELNETRVARELLEFVNRICARLHQLPDETESITLPLGKLRLASEVNQPSQRTYQAELYLNRQGVARLEFTRLLGKEKFYLPASFLVLLQHVINTLPRQELPSLVQGLQRLHLYYHYKRDFWDSAALTEGPRLALGSENISEPDPDYEAP